MVHKKLCGSPTEVALQMCAPLMIKVKLEAPSASHHSVTRSITIYPMGVPTLEMNFYTLLGNQKQEVSNQI
jgi:hypothetical protein